MLNMNDKRFLLSLFSAISSVAQRKEQKNELSEDLKEEEQNITSKLINENRDVFESLGKYVYY